MLGCAFAESGPDAIAQQLTRTRALTSRPVGANFVIIEEAPPIDAACFEAAASLAQLVEFFLCTCHRPGPPPRGSCFLPDRLGQARRSRRRLRSLAGCTSCSTTRASINGL